MSNLEKIKNCYEQAGILIDDNKINMESITSISLVTAFVEIENTFSISIPDCYLAIDTIVSLDFMLELVDSLIEGSINEI